MADFRGGRGKRGGLRGGWFTDKKGFEWFREDCVEIRCEAGKSCDFVLTGQDGLEDGL